MTQWRSQEKGLINLGDKATIIEVKKENSGSFKIISENEQLVVLNSSFEKLGTTPLELDKIIYTGKKIIISNGKEIKHVDLDKYKNEIKISFKVISEELKTNDFKIEVNEEEKRKKIEEEQREKLRKEQDEKERFAYYKKEREIRLKKQKEDNEIREKFEKEQKEKLRIKEVEDRKKREKRTFYTIVIIVICSIVVIGFGVRNYYSNFNTKNTEKVIKVNNNQITNDLPKTEEIVIPEKTIMNKIFYDIYWEVTTESNAEYFRIITFDDMGNPLGKVRDYFISGELQWEGQLIYVDKYDNKNDIMEGKCVWYYKNGNKMDDITYKDGELNGDFTEYYENGEVKAKGVYLNGELWGQYRSFSEEGNEIVENNVFTE